MTEEKKIYTKIETIIEPNECAGCHKIYNQAILVTSLGLICQRYCDECIKKEEIKDKAIEKHHKEERRKEWLKSIGVKETYDKATLGNYQPLTDSQKEALICCKMIESKQLTKLVLLGSNGVGKTHLASALVKLTNGLLITAYEMFSTYRACFNGGKFNELDVIKKFSEVPLLAIDEFGRTKGSEAEENFLSVIVDNRHSSNLPTLILSNLIRKRDCLFYSNNKDACNKCERSICLESRMTKDVISRLRENSRVVLIEGEDYRRK